MMAACTNKPKAAEATEAVAVETAEAAVEAVEAPVAAADDDEMAPNFELPDLQGNLRKLSPARPLPAVHALPPVQGGHAPFRRGCLEGLRRSGMSTALVLLGVLALAGAAAAILRRDRKKGRSPCGGNCASCGGCCGGECRSAGTQERAPHSGAAGSL